MNLPDSLHESAMKNREKIAYYFMDDPTTYEELNVSVNKFASGLAKAGIGEGDHVALFAWKFSALHYQPLWDYACWGDSDSDQSDLYSV